ncbi:TonB-dependent receptor domain-containing protein [Halioxenophilus sp. WMMB6]|uniref:TonB-dependent receptor domain-containing protein n=1 Tax=Halioxenophilus sp. WMMB6 TaxID=3073815 RepID=UPI00295EFE91|nr:TonB-dependent receptor [Halioxenophilus sp. WMMB6]
MITRKLLVTAIAVASTTAAWAETSETEIDSSVLEEVVIIGKYKTYANNAVTDSMLDQQAGLTSVTAVIDNIPGVLVNEGDTFGADDWSTTVSMRGFQLSLDAQQIGMTIDGIPNGNSNYGGGSKANRFIDTLNLAGVEVSQGTADISSRSHEALGGTLNFLTSDPESERGFTVSGDAGEYDAKKVYVRMDTGELFGNTYAWLSYSNAESSDWMEGSAENQRKHVAAKFISELGDYKLTGYYAYDDTEEDNYQRITATEFDINDEWDRLTGDWTGIPYVDQVYRRAWSTLRENNLAYLKLNFDNGALKAEAATYYHVNSGRGDWVPQYVVDPNSGNRITFVDGNGNTLAFIGADGSDNPSIAGCSGSLDFPYGGTSYGAYDPACQVDGAIPVGSYRHTHYNKERFGITADFEWAVALGDNMNTLRGGLWYEDYTREESRNWHQVKDSRVSFSYEGAPYWLQYKNEFPVDTTMVYLEDSFQIGGVTLRAGGKQFFVELDKKDKLSGVNGPSLNSDSDLLPSFGILYQTPVDGLELFAGYAENFAAIKDVVLESAEATADLEPETADNLDVGVRYQNDQLQLSAVYYEIEFDNRITYIAGVDNGTGQNDYLNEVEGTYQNVGGVESNGVELAATYFLNSNLSVYSAYTYNDATYVGTGNAAIDAAVGVVPGNTVIGSPENMWVLSLDWTLGNYRAGISNKWVDDRFITIDNSAANVAPDYSVVDLYLGAEIPFNSAYVDSVDLHLTVNNLFDERYLGGIAGNYGAWLGATRTAVLGVTAKF